MSDPIKPELDLDALFAEARQDAVPPQHLMDAIVADAAVIRAVDVVEPPQPGLWEQMLDALGGWPSLSGLVTATVAGIYIGFVDPTVLETVGFGESLEASTDLMFGDDVFFDDLAVGEG
jgi:hypothetical protein